MNKEFFEAVKLLESENNYLQRFRFVFNAVSKIHIITSI